MQTVVALFLWLLVQSMSLAGLDQGSVQVSPVDQSVAVHPFHVTVTEVHQNSTARTLEVQCKFFTDDFESTLKKVYNQKADLVDAKLHRSMDSLVNRYVQSHLQLRLNGRPVALQYLGFEQEREATYVYLEAEDVTTSIRTLEASCRFLYETFSDQVNIFHVSTDNGKKSSKLDHPVTDIRLDF